jgi:hypothetical protein
VRGDREVKAARERSEAEIDAMRARNPRAGREALRIETVKVGDLEPMRWVWFDFRRKIAEGLGSSLRDIAAMRLDASSNKKLKAELKRLEDHDRTLREAAEALLSAKRFLSKENLQLLSLWVPERLFARRRAVQQWINGKAHAALMTGVG